MSERTRIHAEASFERSQNPVRRKIAALSLATSLTLGLGACSDVDGAQFPSIHFGESNQSCAPISDETIQETKSIFTSLTNGGLAPESTPSQINANRVQIAANLGLTVYDPDTEFSDLKLNLISGTPSNLPTQNYMNVLEAMAERYDVKIQYDSSEVQSGQLGDTTAFPETELAANQNVEVKQELYDLTRTLSYLPVELVKDMGLKNIVFVHIGSNFHAANGGETAGFVVTSKENPDTMYIDPTKFSEGILAHELTHIWDAKECGITGMDADTQFMSYNPAPTTDGEDFYAAHDGYYSPTGATAAAGPLYASLDNAWDVAERQSITEQIDAIQADVVVANDYGFSNVAEDKATIGEELLSKSILSDVNDPDSPILAKKSLFLAARLYATDKKSVEYLAQSGVQSLNLGN